MSVEALKEQVCRIRSIYDRFHDHIREHEVRTRAVLIDPILREIGWDVADPSRVRLEEKANGNVIDYLLYKDNRKYAVLEAKRLRESLDTHRKQASGYAVEVGVLFVLVTNGMRWEAWKITPGSPRKNSVIAEINLTTGDAEEVAASLQRLSYDALGSQPSTLSSGRG